MIHRTIITVDSIYSISDNWNHVRELLTQQFRPKNDPAIFWRGKYNNLIITNRYGKLQIQGSIYHCFAENWWSNYSLAEYLEAVKRLSDELKVDISFGHVSSIELGANIRLDSPVNDYLKQLGPLRNFRRDESKGDDVLGKTLYYFQTRRTLILYDKTMEQKKRNLRRSRLLGHEMSPNILRYELRLKNFGGIYKFQGTVKLTDLIHGGFIKQMWHEWRRLFLVIVKEKQFTSELGLACLADFKGLIMAKGIMALGENELYDLIEWFSSEKIIGSQKKHAFRKVLDDFSSQTKILKPTSLMVELRRGVNQMFSKYFPKTGGQKLPF
jgi:hypothetical protein